MSIIPAISGVRPLRLRRAILSGLAAAAFVALVACITVAQPATPVPAATTAAAPAATPAAAKTLTDSAGRQVQLKHLPVKRIVSLAPNATEILFALGAGDRVVGIDDASNYPPEAAGIQKVGSMTPDIERIVSLQPDLVVGASITGPDVIDKLQAAGLAFWVADSKDVRGVAAAIRSLGAALDLSERAETIAAELEKQIDAVVQKVSLAGARPKVFLELDAADPTKPYTVGPGNFVNDLITLAGGDNVFGDAATDFPQVSFEQILARDPEALILADAPYGTTAAAVKARTGWDKIRAVANARILEVSADLNDQISRPGPRIGEALKSLARFLNPELFG